LAGSEGGRLPSKITLRTSADADDVVQLALHCGASAIAMAASDGGWRVDLAMAHDVSASAPMLTPLRHARIDWWEGRVWCVAIPCGLIVVRRLLQPADAGGSPSWSRPVIVGNCTAIKDGLMVQAVSHRYRRKMTTTVYFAPMPISTSLAHNPTAPINLPPGVLAAASGTPVLSHLTHHLLPTAAGLVASSASLFPDPLAIRVAECAAAAAEAQASAAAMAAAADLEASAGGPAEPDPAPFESGGGDDGHGDTDTDMRR